MESYSPILKRQLLGLFENTQCTPELSFNLWTMRCFRKSSGRIPLLQVGALIDYRSSKPVLEAKALGA